MKDRVPTYPGRVLITPESGGAPFYATMTRADEATVTGTPYNKATQLTDATAKLLKLAQEDPTVNDALYAIATALGKTATLDNSGLLPTGVLPTIPTDKLPTVPVNKGGTGKTLWTANRLIYPSAADVLAQLANPTVDGSVLRQGASGAPYWTSLPDLVTALGAAGGVRIQTGSYTGTGTYGEKNPCSIPFDFPPKLVIVARKAPGGSGANGNVPWHVGQTDVSITLGSTIKLTWADNVVKWYAYSNATADYQLNVNKIEYAYIGIG